MLSATDDTLYEGATRRIKKYEKVISTEFTDQLLSFRQCLKSDLKNISNVSQLAALLICDNCAMCSRFQEVLTVILLYLILSVTLSHVVLNVHSQN